MASLFCAIEDFFFYYIFSVWQRIFYPQINILTPTLDIYMHAYIPLGQLSVFTEIWKCISLVDLVLFTFGAHI